MDLNLQNNCHLIQRSDKIGTNSPKFRREDQKILETIDEA